MIKKYCKCVDLNDHKTSCSTAIGDFYGCTEKKSPVISKEILTMSQDVLRFAKIYIINSI